MKIVSSLLLLTCLKLYAASEVVGGTEVVQSPEAIVFQSPEVKASQSREAGAPSSPVAPNSEVVQSTTEEELRTLGVEANELPPVIEREKLYSVQTRYTPLKHRFEFTLGGTKNFTPDSMTSSSQVDYGLRFFLSDRWSVGANGAYVFNSLSNAGKNYLENAGIAPDIGYPKYRADLMGAYHTFYGKIRFSMDSVIYFDQYVALGPAWIKLQTGQSVGAAGDIGFAFWIGHHFSARLGVKDYFFEEKRIKTKNWVHHVMGHVDVGYIF